MERTLVIGIGNEDRGDDVAGLSVIERLRIFDDLNCELYQNSGNLLQLLDLWHNREVIIIDSILTPYSIPGEIIEIDLFDPLIPLAEEKVSIRHGLELKEIVELSIILEKEPKSAHLIGITGSNWEVGIPANNEVETAIDKVFKSLLKKFSTVLE